jgi:hypothetical protein
MESANYAAVQIADSLASHGIKLVPDILVNGGSGSGSGSGSTLVDVLVANLIQAQQAEKATKGTK